MNTPRRLLVTLVMALPFAAAAAGCSSAPDGAAAQSADAAAPRAKAVAFAECMRSSGVSAFPDPDASGRLTLDGVLNGSSLDPNSAEWKRAISACKSLSPPGFTGTKATPAQLKARLEFAQCVREHGVPDFPDPTADGPLVDTNRIPSSATANGMTLLNAAMHTCSAYSSAAGVSKP